MWGIGGDHSISPLPSEDAGAKLLEITYILNQLISLNLMPSAPEPIAKDFLALMERAILQLRMRIRYGEEVSLKEVHDFLHALHNVPTMLRNYGGWHVEENIEADLARYDELWLSQPGSEFRKSLVKTLEDSRQGMFDYE
jgi:hypothetical protein